MSTVKVEICCGTACYLLGAAKLVTIEDSLPESCRGRVEIEARTCLDLCERDNLGGAPYVRFNNTEVMAQATPERVMKRILELVEGVA
jgi:NADH:ubiquinone oxidoreductase subunit E